MTLLQAQNLICEKGGRRILNDISFAVKPGEILGLVGPNGSGKSTLLKAIAGLLPEVRGKVLFRGRDLLRATAIERALSVSYVGSDFTSEFPITAEEAVGMGGFAHFPQTSPERRALVQRAMEICGCWEFRQRFLEELSGGECQRVAIARAFVQNSPLVCLDESLSKLDLHHQVRMAEVLKNASRDGKSFILVSHDLNFTIDWADRCLLLQGGQAVAIGEVPAVMSEKNLRTLYPDANFFLNPHPVNGRMKVYFKG